MASTKPSSPQAPVDSPARRRLPPLLRRAWYGLNQAFRRRMPAPKVTPDQFTALRTLSEADPKGITQSALTSLMSSDPNTIAALTERMEKAGWVARKPHERDRRAYRLRLRPAGLRKFEQLRDIAVELQVQALAALPEERREQFLADLALVADACREAADKASAQPQQ